MSAESIKRFILSGSLLLVLFSLAAPTLLNAQSSGGQKWSSAKGKPKRDKNPWESEPPTPNPEPLTMALFGTGLVGIGAMVRRRRRLQQGQ